MKKKLTPHTETGGPVINVDLDDVSIIEEYGQRSSRGGWVEAVITLRFGKELRVKLSLTDMDDLIELWEGVTTIQSV
jgi:hypothetical protein